MAAEDAVFEASSFEHALALRQPLRWIGWRRRLLVLTALLACLGLLLVARVLSHAPSIDAQWQSDPRGLPVLVASGDSRLATLTGQALRRVQSGPHRIDLDNGLRLQAPRWTVGDDQRMREIEARITLGALLSAGPVVLTFEDGTEVEVLPVTRGLRGLGLGFWLLAAPALMLLLVGAAVVLARPQRYNLLYALMAVCQSASLVWIGAEFGGVLTPWPAVFANDLPWRLGLDLVTAAAAVHAFALYPKTLPRQKWIASAAWSVAALVLLAAVSAQFPGIWWWGQGTLLVLGAAALLVLHRSYRLEPNPFSVVMRRFGVAALGTMVVVDTALVAAAWRPAMAEGVAQSAVLVWSLFFASLMVLVPFLPRARRLLREFAMLAGLSTVATSLDLLFVSLFSLEPFASLTLSVFIALAAYAGARQWILDQLIGSRVLTTERTFEQLYRIAREVQKRPERRIFLLSQLLRDLFDPMEVVHVRRAESRARVLDGGSALVVPVRAADVDDKDAGALSLMLRFARRGRRIFTREDARLTDRIVEQLRRAVAYDQAVERGRTEERMRIAQDLHDDIGARLLTLMYKAPDPGMEDYLRQTLKDLKTLTRGLAASDHRLSHAVGEWKADVQQRLTAAHIGLSWSFRIDEDIDLGVVQWSGVTRVLRELVSNAIYHAHATRLEIQASLKAGELRLRVSDDGVGRNPSAWLHGLGLGGIRKRVKQLGGRVDWAENHPTGIVCEVTIPEFLKAD